jgi:hypothetical protein
MEKIGPGMEKVRIRDKHPGAATLFLTLMFQDTRCCPTSRSQSPICRTTCRSTQTGIPGPTHPSALTTLPHNYPSPSPHLPAPYPGILVSFSQRCGSGSAWIRIIFGGCIRIQVPIRVLSWIRIRI